MTIYSDILHWSDITQIFDPITYLHLVTHRKFATGAASKQMTLTPPETWPCPTLGLVSDVMLRPISPELVLFPDFWVSSIHRYFCFAFKIVYPSKQKSLVCISTTYCVSLLVAHRFQRVHAANQYDRLRLIFSWLKNVILLVYYTIPFSSKLFLPNLNKQ